MLHHNILLLQSGRRFLAFSVRWHQARTVCYWNWQVLLTIYAILGSKVIFSSGAVVDRSFKALNRGSLSLGDTWIYRLKLHCLIELACERIVGSVLPHLGFLLRLQIFVPICSLAILGQFNILKISNTFLSWNCSSSLLIEIGAKTENTWLLCKRLEVYLSLPILAWRSHIIDKMVKFRLSELHEVWDVVLAPINDTCLALNWLVVTKDILAVKGAEGGFTGDSGSLILDELAAELGQEVSIHDLLLRRRTLICHVVKALLII